jgi:hypothetical protein
MRRSGPELGARSPSGLLIFVSLGRSPVKKVPQNLQDLLRSVKFGGGQSNIEQDSTGPRLGI